MKDCLFCKIIAGEISASVAYEDDFMIIIRDIDPKAVNHYLMIPKRHYKTVTEMSQEDAEILGRCMRKLRDLVPILGLSSGFRMIINQGDDAGQTVPHLHVHILSGQKMNWIPA